MKLLNAASFFCLLAVVVLCSSNVFGGPETDELAPPDTQLMRQSGKLFTIEISPGDSSIHVKGAGKSLVQYRPEELVIFGRSVTGPNQRLDLHLVSDTSAKGGPAAYKIVEPLRPATVLEVEVREKKHGKSERFEFKMR